MVCDICSSPGTGTIISANQMLEAVFDRGFNPYRMGLGIAAITMVGEQEADQLWNAEFLAHIGLDWNICAKCMATLKPCLGEQSKKWWQFWK